MNFDELHEMIPYVTGGKEKSLTFSPYPNIELAMPGRHAMDTDPVGGDFVVRVTDDRLEWGNHEFTHTDIFEDVRRRAEAGARDMENFMRFYLLIVRGESPENAPFTHHGLTIHPQTFFRAIQCLAVAEHRRYARFEKKFGGRYLPFRFAVGIAEGLWTADDAVGMQRKGRPGVEILEKVHGVPKLTKELMS